MANLELNTTHCKLCGRELDNGNDPFSKDCGGDCVVCMAGSGDPHALEILRAQPAPSATAIQAEAVRLLRQALWDCFAAEGGDIDGDPTQGVPVSDPISLAADRVKEERSQAEARIAELERVQGVLVGALKEARQALQAANDTPAGPIRDTIWMIDTPETLFDFMDAAIASAQKPEGGDRG